jgi:predicted metal-dependent hydrolase
MKTMPTLVLALPLLLAAVPALAETYKCKDADGRITYQGQPCQPGAVVVVLSPPAPVPPEQVERARAEAARLRQQQEQDSRRQQEREAERTAAAQVEAAERAAHCQAARRQLGVAKSGRPIYTYDNAGEKRYVDDKSRAAMQSEAERRVAAHCL